jgi:hypothetical protein
MIQTKDEGHYAGRRLARETWLVFVPACVEIAQRFNKNKALTKQLPDCYSLNNVLFCKHDTKQSGG